MNLLDLQRFSIPDRVEVVEGPGGLAVLRVASDVSTAEIFPHGAHVARFTPRGQRPLLFVSKKSHFTTGKPIRGGVPLIFPWFGPHPTDSKLPAHGLVRTRAWAVSGVTTEADGSVCIGFSMASDAGTEALWSHQFSLAFTVTVGSALTMTLAVKNTGSDPFRFEAAMHTYLAVSDVRKVKIDGLQGREFIDKTAGAVRKTQRESPFGITGETDRVYVNTRDTVTVTDPGGSMTGGPRIITVNKTGADATVVWNPWIAKAVALADFDDNEWPDMLCIETACASDNAIILAPGATHELSASISAT